MTSRRPRRRPGENRELLIDAGLAEFGLLGYHGASTQAIAARADVPQPHVYTNFATKQDLFLACLTRARDLYENPAADTESLPVAFLYQAVAAVGDPQLSPSLGETLSDLKQSIGEPRFQEFLSEGSRCLMGASRL